MKGCGAFVCDQDPAPTVRIRDLNRRFGAFFSGSNFNDRTTQTALDPLAGSRFVPHRFGGLVPGLRFKFAFCRRWAPSDSEAPLAVARDVVALSGKAEPEGRRAATRAGSLDAARAASASGLVMLCHSARVALVRSIQEAESQLTEQLNTELMCSGIIIVKVLDFT
jgi:hypothetical protein